MAIDAVASALETNVMLKFVASNTTSDSIRMLQDQFKDIANSVTKTTLNFGQQLDVVAKISHDAQIRLDSLNKELLTGMNQLELNNQLGLSNDKILEKLGKLHLQTLELIKDHKFLNSLNQDQQASLLKASKQLGEINDKYNSMEGKIKAITEKLNEMGLRGLGAFITNITSATKLMSGLSEQVKKYLEMSSKWTSVNHLVYGSQAEINKMVFQLAKTSQMGTEQMAELVNAMMKVGVTKKGISELGTAMGDYVVMTGASGDATAAYVKQLEAMGIAHSEIKTKLDDLALASQKYGITGEELGKITQQLADKAQILNSALGPKGFEEYSDAMLNFSGAARKAGVDVGVVTNVMDAFATDSARRAKMFALSGGFDSGASAAENFTKMLGQTDQMVQMMGDNMIVAEQYATSFGFNSANEVKQLNTIFKSMDAEAKATGKTLLEISKTKFGNVADLKKVFDKTPLEKFTEAWDKLKIALEPTLIILSSIIGAVASTIKFITDLVSKLPGWGQVVANVVIITGLAVMYFKGTIGGLIGMVGGLITKLLTFTGIIGKTAAATQAAGAAAVTGGTSFGAGLKGMIATIKTINPGDILRFAMVMGVLVGTLWALSVVLKDADPVKMLAFSASIVILAIAAKFMGTVGIMAAAGFLVFSTAVMVLASAMLIASYAFKVFVEGIEKLVTIGIGNVMAFAGGFIVVAASMLIGATLMALAMIPGAAMLPLSIKFLMAMTFITLAIGVFSLVKDTASEFASFGVSMFAGMLALMGAVGIGALMLVPAIPFLVASILTNLGIGFILGAFADNMAVIAMLPVIAANFSNAMYSVSWGMEYIADSSYIRFAAASASLTSGLNNILAVIGYNQAAISALPAVSANFAGAMRAVADGMDYIADVGDIDVSDFTTSMDAVVSSMSSIGVMLGSYGSVFGQLPSIVNSLRDLISLGGMNSNDLLTMASNLSLALYAIGGAAMLYSEKVEEAIGKVYTAMVKVAAMSWLSKVIGVEHLVKTSAVVSVRTDVDERNARRRENEEQQKTLDEINSNMVKLVTVAAGIGASNNVDKVTAILNILREHLPEIAEGRSSGLASSSTRW